MPADRLAKEASIEELVDRVLSVREASGQDTEFKPRVVEAVLGGAKEPSVRVSDALELFFTEIAVDDTLYKSDQQKRTWQKVKRTSIQYFIDVVGDLDMREIDRNEHALRFKKWWIEKMEPSKGGTAKPISANKLVQPPCYVPLIFDLSISVSGTGGRMFSA